VKNSTYGCESATAWRVDVKIKPFVRLLSSTGILLIVGLLLATSYASLPQLVNTRAKQLIPDSNGIVAQAQTRTAPDVVSDWTQVAFDPQRSGRTPEAIGSNYKVLWVRKLQPEKIFPQVQVIIALGKVYVGTEMGKMHAYNALTGADAWVYTAGGPILASAGVLNGRVYFGAMDGSVYALDCATGGLVWKSNLAGRFGFSTAPLIADGKIMLGGRNGVFYALTPDTGAVIWQYSVGAPILQTAAWDAGKVYFGAMNMKVYALNSASGQLAWASAPIPQMGFKDYWPVVYNNRVIIRPMGAGSIGSADLSDAAQHAELAKYDQNPAAYKESLYILDASSGQKMPGVIHWDSMTQHGATTPPCVDRDGYLIVPAPKANNGQNNYWARLSLSTRKVVQLFTNASDGGMNPVDESSNVSCTANMVLGFKADDHAWNYAINLDTQAITQIPEEFALVSGDLTAGTMGGGGNPVSVANGIIYHAPTMHAIVARSTR
jgi:hypothetical protein